MSSASLKKIIPCKKDQAVEMVLDIEKYPEFVPWCIEGKIFDKNESSDLITFNGDLKVGKSILNETFSSHVSYHKEIDKIIVTNLDGPLKHLKNEWLLSFLCYSSIVILKLSIRGPNKTNQEILGP